MKAYHLIVALTVAAILSGGSFVYTYTGNTASVDAIANSGNIATVENAATQPDWQSVLDDLASENKTRGEVPGGDLFTVTPNPAYNGDLSVKVYLANTDNLTKAYEDLSLELYLEGSVEAGETPSYRTLTLDNGSASFILPGGTGSYTLSVIDGEYRLVSDNPSEWAEGWSVTPELYCETTQK
jgi:hypothetical protein